MLAELPDAAKVYLKRPFSEFWKAAVEAGDSEWSTLEENLGSVEIFVPDFDTEEDRHGKELADEGWGEFTGALGKAERMLGAFEDAARILAELISRYKLEELEREAKNLRSQSYRSIAKRDLAMIDAARLDELCRQLRKHTRIELRVTEIKG